MNTSLLEKPNFESVFSGGEILKNIDIKDLAKYKSEIQTHGYNQIVVMYSGKEFSDLTDLMHECIAYYSLIPDILTTSKTRIISFSIKLKRRISIFVF